MGGSEKIIFTNRRPEASSEELNETFPKRMELHETSTYSFADEKIENNQDRKWEKAVDNKI